VKTLESKETRAQRNDADNAQFSLCCTSTKDAGFDSKIDIRRFSFLAHCVRLPHALKNLLPQFVKRCGNIMRRIIISSITPEDAQNLRRLRAVEGYVDLGMFQEAEEELRELDPAWLVFDQILSLQMRVYAGLNEGK